MLPRPCPRCSPAHPSHTYPSTCVTPSSSPALTGRCGAAARAAGPGCKKGGAGGAGGAPTKAAMASITTSRPRVTGRHRVRSHPQPRPRSVEPTCLPTMLPRLQPRHYCLRPPPPPPPPPALTQTSIRPRRRRLRTLRHHPRAPLAASTLRPAGATSSMRPRPLHALQHGLCWCRRRPSRRLRICWSSLDRGHVSARRVRACLLRPAGPRASVQPAGASCAGGRGELWPARCP